MYSSLVGLLIDPIITVKVRRGICVAEFRGRDSAGGSGVLKLEEVMRVEHRWVGCGLGDVELEEMRVEEVVFGEVDGRVS